MPYDVRLNAVGYANVNVPKGFSVETVVFKNVTGGKFDLKNIKPCDPNGKVLNLADSWIYVRKINEQGNYGDVIKWYGKKLGGWSILGDKVIDDGQFTLEAGEGLLVNNSLKVDADGNEKVAKKDTFDSVAKFLVSGEVDLVCKNAAPTGFSVMGNSTPVAINLKDIVPTDPNGKTLNLADSWVYVRTINEQGNYGDVIKWYGKKLGGWSINGEKIIGDEVAPLEPGTSFLVNNSLKVDASGNEKVAKKDTYDSPVILTLPSPIK